MTVTGDCFHAAFNLFVERPGATLCHGRPVYQGDGPGEADDGRYWHAWVEVDGVVLDHSNGRETEIPAVLYYGLGNIDEVDVRRYESREAVHYKASRYRHSGPWDEKHPPVEFAEED